MPVIRIDGFDDPRLADYRNVSDGELLRRGNRFVAEGRLVVSRLVASGHRIDSILLNEASLRALEPALSGLATHVPVYVSGTAELSAITGFNLHRGCLALAERPPERVLADVVRKTERLLVLEGVTDADNVGSAFRNAAAFGASVLLSPTCCDPLYRKAIRTSMGSVLATPYARAETWPDDLRALKAEGFEVVALTPPLGHRRSPRTARLENGSALRCSSAAKVQDFQRKPKRWPTCASAFRSAQMSIR